MDNRQDIRHRALVLVKVQNGQLPSEPGLVYNTSRDGMFVLSNIEVNQDDVVSLEIEIPELAFPMRISGRAVHYNKNGFGMSFDELDEVARALVRKLTSRYRETWDGHSEAI